jgi:hypothetical protein
MQRHNYALSLRFVVIRIYVILNLFQDLLMNHFLCVLEGPETSSG